MTRKKGGLDYNGENEDGEQIKRFLFHLISPDYFPVKRERERERERDVKGKRRRGR